MTPRNRLILFLKAPRLGAVKTRLAKDVGKLAAWRFYHWQTRRLVRDLAADTRWQTILAVTPDRVAYSKGPWPKDIARLCQGKGDLGDRMSRVFRNAPSGPALILGGDIPGVQRHHIAEAFDLLRSNDAVFGPAEDGGYWLVGLSRRRAVPGLFHAVRWSSADALADTLANLRGRRIGMLERLSDVDTQSDYESWKNL